MPTYAYRARDSRGQAVQGRLEAGDERAAVQALRARGLIVTGLEPVRGGAPAAQRPRPAPAGSPPGRPVPGAPPRPARPGVPAAPGAAPGLAAAPAPVTIEIDLTRLAQALGGLFARRKHFPLRDLAVFCRQFASILEAGVPIMHGLQVVGKEIHSKQLKAALSTLGDDLEAGRSLSDAVAAREGVFPPIFHHVITAGEQGGFLEESFRRLADHFEKEDRLNQKIKSATLYPKVIAFVSFLVVIMMVTFIVPSFADIFDGMDVPIPLMTRAILAVSGFLQRFWFLLPLPIIGAMVGLRAYGASPGGRRNLDTLALRVPVFGPLALKRALAVFSRTLGTLLRGGVPILQALDLSEKTVGNVILEEVVHASTEDVREGGSMLDAMRASPHFPKVFIEMLNVGDETGRTEEMLHRVAEFYEADVERTAERLTSLIEPMIIVFLGGIVALILLSVFLPMFTVYEGLQQQ